MAVARDHNTNFVTALKLIDLSNAEPVALRGDYAGEDEAPLSNWFALTQELGDEPQRSNNTASSPLKTRPRQHEIRQPPLGLQPVRTVIRPRLIVSSDAKPIAVIDHPSCLASVIESILDEVAIEIAHLWSQRSQSQTPHPS